MTEKNLKTIRQNIKSKLIESLIQQGYLIRGEVTKEQEDVLDEAIDRRNNYNILDYHVEALFMLEGYAAIPIIDQDRFDWRLIFDPNDKSNEEDNT